MPKFSVEMDLSDECIRDLKGAALLGGHDGDVESLIRTALALYFETWTEDFAASEISADMKDRWRETGAVPPREASPVGKM